MRNIQSLWGWKMAPFWGFTSHQVCFPASTAACPSECNWMFLGRKKDGWSFHYWYLYQLMMRAATDVVVKPMSLLKKTTNELSDFVNSTRRTVFIFFCFFDQRSIWGLNHFALNWAFNEPKLLSRIGFMGSSVRCRRQVQNMFFVWTKYRLI